MPESMNAHDNPAVQNNRMEEATVVRACGWLEDIGKATETRTSDTEEERPVPSGLHAKELAAQAVTQGAGGGADSHVDRFVHLVTVNCDGAFVALSERARLRQRTAVPS